MGCKKIYVWRCDDLQMYLFRVEHTLSVPSGCYNMKDINSNATTMLICTSHFRNVGYRCRASRSSFPHMNNLWRFDPDITLQKLNTFSGRCSIIFKARSRIIFYCKNIKKSWIHRWKKPSHPPPPSPTPHSPITFLFLMISLILNRILYLNQTGIKTLFTIRL